LSEYIDKAARVVGVSAGPYGRTRGIQDLLPVLRELGLVAIFWDVNIGLVGQVFDESGRLLDNSLIRRTDKFLDELVWMARSCATAATTFRSDKGRRRTRFLSTCGNQHSPELREPDLRKRRVPSRGRDC
jgi:hypothetical protein